MKDWKAINAARAGYIAQKNAANAEITTLTPEQHEAIQQLCSDRHDLHIATDGLYLMGTQDSALWSRLVDNGSTCAINDYLTEARLPAIAFPDIIDTPIDTDLEYLGDDEIDAAIRDYHGDDVDIDDDNRSDLYYDYGKSVANELGERIDSLIYDYLHNIDLEHETDYAPSGGQRIL